MICNLKHNIIQVLWCPKKQVTNPKYVNVPDRCCHQSNLVHNVASPVAPPSNLPVMKRLCYDTEPNHATFVTSTPCMPLMQNSSPGYPLPFYLASSPGYPSSSLGYPSSNQVRVLHLQVNQAVCGKCFALLHNIIHLPSRK